ncbi:FtsX-like permease family protein [Microtetraspora fusca]|uniref:FtsX-like permease family protein n=1 Tax=Microtetraspora fusca TaxID=1997 RepID=UPI0008332449|nr:FtsX-like permease family protein [Microtetraspora fusca]
MIRLAWARLRRELGRSLVLLAGILVAATGFTVLTGTAETQRLEIVGTVGKNFRAQYDILVRPKGSITELERTRSLVRQNYLSGIFGGITLDQYEKIKRINGVDVAAPIGMVGYVTRGGSASVDVTDVLHKGDRTMLRVDQTRVADRGLTRIPYGGPLYQYVTRRPVRVDVGPGRSGDARQFAKEKLASGQEVGLGPSLLTSGEAKKMPVRVFPSERETAVGFWSTETADGFEMTPERLRDVPRGHALVQVDQEFPFMLAAVDPDAEARLAGLDQAMVAGRYLRAREDYHKYRTTPGNEVKEILLLAAARPYVDQRDEVVIRRLPAAAAEKVVKGTPAAALKAYLGGQDGEVVKRATLDAEYSYTRMLDAWEIIPENWWTPLTRYWTAGPTEYREQSESRLAAIAAHNAPEIWKNPANEKMFGEVATYIGGGERYASAPAGAADAQFRPLHPVFVPDIGMLATRVIGRFDPEKLPGFSELAGLPMETYQPPAARPGDSRTGKLLGGRDLLPNDNVGGYLQMPPLLLTNLEGLGRINSVTGGTAPLSVVRVRVAGVTGPDAVSRERISQVARDIVAATGLDVDITIGSSPSPMTVDLPAGSYGRPALTLEEGWVNKGVAYRILTAADRKSLILFTLILAVCGMFVVNAASAAVRACRVELGVLGCLGWSRPRMFGAVLTEVGVIGLLAGCLSAALAAPLSSWAGLPDPGVRAWLAVPAALLLALLAGLAPAWQASRVPPVEAVRPAVRLPARARSPRGVTGLALAGLRRAPGRAVLGASTLTVAVFALTLLLGVTYGFRGRVVGSLLGDAVVLQARTADYVAIAVMFALAALALADVLYLGIRERDAELAALRATGWSGGAMARLIVTEGVAIGLVGALTGAVLGLAASLALAGELPVAVIAGAGAAGAVGSVLAALAAVAPALFAQRLPLARLLAQE